VTSILKVDTIQTTTGDTIISETANVVTVGQAGDTVVNSGNTTIKGDGASADGKLILNCSQNTHGVGIQAPPHSATANYTLILPNNTGSNAQVLTTNGAGVLAWANDQIITGFPTITSATPSGLVTSAVTSVVIAGTNFLTGCTVEFINSTTGAILLPASFTIDSTTQITASVNISVNGAYFIRVENTTGLAGRSSTALMTVSTGPQWQTAIGTLGTFAGGFSGDVATVVATGDATLAYSSLTPVLTQTSAGGANCTFNTATGVISSTNFALNDGTPTTYNFSIRVTDGDGQTSDRAFTLTSSYGATGGGQFN
jgi:hypothetical protein